MNLKVKQNIDVNPQGEEGEGKGLKRSAINEIVKSRKEKKREKSGAKESEWMTKKRKKERNTEWNGTRECDRVR